MTIKVCLAGATGWAGSALARGMVAAPDLTLVAAVSRKVAGRTLADVLAEPRLATPVFASAAQALATPCDVFVEYTKPDSAKANVLQALERAGAVVVGTSGLTDADYAEIDARAKAHAKPVLACGNFALTVVLMQKFAEAAARWIPSWEIVDYAHEDKPDAPSGTARELASRLAAVRTPEVHLPIDQVRGSREARGGTVSGTQVHSIRVPGFTLSTEVIFGMGGQRLSIRHDTGPSAEPYVEGALLAIRKVATLPPGVHRGLDKVLEMGSGTFSAPQASR